MIYNLEKMIWTEIKILKYPPSVCVINLEETFIYVFVNENDIIYKYDIISFREAVIVPETNLCSNGIGQGIIAANGKAYLHGCYIYGTWKTLVFNMETDKFEGLAESMDVWLEQFNQPTTGTYNEQQGRMAILEYNVLMMITPKFNSLRFSFSFTDMLTYNFESTQEIMKSQLWPSQLVKGIQLKYEVTSTGFGNWEEWSNPPYYIWLYSDDMSEVINETLEIVNSNDTCTNQLALFFWGTLYTCTQYFMLPLTLADNNLTELTLDMIAQHVELKNYSGIDNYNSYFMKPLMIPSYLTIQLIRCNILLDTINDASHSNDPFINISYSLERQCYSGYMSNFSFNLSIISSENLKINIQKEVIFTIINNYSHICLLCENGNCTLCHAGNMTIKHDIIEQDDILSVIFESNTIDLNVYSAQDLSVLYLQRRENTTHMTSKLKFWQIILICVCSFSLCLIITTIICYYNKRNKRLSLELEQQEKCTNYIKNPLVLCIGISSYEYVSNANLETEIYCQNLCGIDRDYENIKTLCKFLNYDIYPQYDKYNWTQDDMITFLNERAQDIGNENKKKYDGILVIISGHGYNKNIITADYQIIDKTAIHRIFSTNYPCVRLLPRIFIFDCCDGNQERSHYLTADCSDDESDDVETSAVKGAGDKSKNFGVDDIKIEQYEQEIWKRDQKNPDWRLSLIHAANEGFQAKMNSVDGSYLIYQFVKRMIANIENKTDELYFGEIIDKIQQYLHDEGKQQIKSVFNNHTRYLKFRYNDNPDQNGQDNDNKEILETKTDNISEYDMNNEMIDDLLDYVDNMDMDGNEEHNTTQNTVEMYMKIKSDQKDPEQYLNAQRQLSTQL
eukprot:41530_1